jgi:hypothetical protein
MELVDRREYEVSVRVNSRMIHKVVIDSHYEVKHGDVMSDELILRLVRLMDGETYLVQDRREPFEYFVADQMELDGKSYKLVWLLEDDKLYIGVINAYRR